MIIKTNTGKELKVLEKNIIVKDGRLYNKDKKFYEAIDGDRICFITYTDNGYKVSTAGTVEGYTSNGKVKLRGVQKPYSVDGGYTIEHMTKVVDYTDENAVIASTVFAD